MADIVGTSGADTLVGTPGADVIMALDGNDILLGGDGFDQLYGGAGNDTYIIDDDSGDEVIELANEGSDLIYVAHSYTLKTDSAVEVVSANNHAAVIPINLTGNNLANTLLGNSGANILNGLGGADLLYGYGGNDIYFVDDAADRVVEQAGEGTDTLYTSLSYVLAGGMSIENLSTSLHAATTAINLTGNALANTLVGNNGVNILDGGGGNDTLQGLGGNDIYYIDVAAVVVLEEAGGGADLIYTSVSYTLGAASQVETLSTMSHAATTAINLTGNGINNTLVGNNGANILDGGGGNDTLQGLGGNDTYFIDVASVLVLEEAGGGADLIYTSVSYTLGAASQVETLSTVSHAATTAINLTGNGINNTIFGNAGANVIDGKGGNDTLIGLGGADTFAFTTPLGPGNVDLITDFAVGIDKIQLAGVAGEPFAALASGTLRAGTLVIGAAALDADDYLLYNSATGALLYDADGNGAGAAVQFATLATGLGLTGADFMVAGPANNAPSISSSGASSVPENSPASTIVYQAAATDGDGDRITYSLTGADASLLTIDQNGAVRLNQPADFETKSTYSFSVVASDSAASTAKAVTLTVTDVSEGGPSTPIINETASANDSTGTAQLIDRNIFLVANNGNLPDQSLPSATIVGDLPNSSDKDFFSITLQAGEKLILDVDFSGGNLDSFLRVYGPNGLELGNNDDAGGLDPGSAPHPTYGHNTDSTFSFRAATSGTYYFSIESFQDATNPTFGSYQINVSIGPVASPAQIIAEDVDALVSGSQWNDTDLTFGFPTSATQYPTTFKEVNPASDFEAFSAAQQAATRMLLQLVSNVSSLTFNELFGGTGTGSGAGHADLRYAMSRDDDVEVAYAYYPTNGGATSAGGSAWFNTTSFNLPVKGNYAWMGILHETGHALGLKHGHEPPAISPDRDSVEYSVMTYRSYPGQDLTAETGYTNARFGYPQTLMMYDIAALQKIYGPNNAYNGGNSVYTWDPATGETFINGVGQGKPGEGDPFATAENSNRVFMTIWDGGGTDTYNLSAYANATVIDLRPGEWTTTSSVQLAGLGNGHTARGNVANALMYQEQPSSLIENAIGGSGADTIIANQVANSLTGNGGADSFTWRASTDAGIGAAADTITDFQHGTDRIDLSQIDAEPASANTNNAFLYIDTNAFHNVAGELRYQVEGDHLRVQADLDGNGVADMEIVVYGTMILSNFDFFA
jgi:Ca2+-binding RTX toxin-like protein